MAFALSIKQRNGKSSVTNDSSEDPELLNSWSRQGVITMSEFLAANSPTNQGLPLHPSTNLFWGRFRSGIRYRYSRLVLNYPHWTRRREQNLDQPSTAADKLILTFNSRTQTRRKGFRLSRRTTSQMDPISVIICRITCNIFPLLIGVPPVPS